MSNSELTLYVKHQGNVDLLIVTLYVGDLILSRSNVKIIEGFKKDIVNKYEMCDVGLLHYFLGVKVCWYIFWSNSLRLVRSACSLCSS
jgi:hypothetical protein